jgi:hypothetical protein
MPNSPRRPTTRWPRSRPHCPSVPGHADHGVLRAVRVDPKQPLTIDPAAMRRAMWEECALDIAYADVEGRETERRIWPLSVVFFERALIVLAHYRLRDDFRSFRLDRILTFAETDESFRPRRAAPPAGLSAPRGESGLRRRPRAGSARLGGLRLPRCHMLTRTFRSPLPYRACR